MQTRSSPKQETSSNSKQREQSKSQTKSTGQRVFQNTSGHPSFSLQRNLGNRGMQQLLNDRSIQAKGNVKSPNEVFDQETDRVVAQLMRRSGLFVEPRFGTAALLIQRTADQENPDRYRTINENLFVRAPSGGTLRQWVNPSQGNPGTARAIISQFKTVLRAAIAANPASVGGTVPTRTTESDAESDAITIDQSIRTRFPQITTQLSASQIRSAIGILTPTQTSDIAFLHQWLANRLSMWTDIDDFNIQETDARYKQMLSTLLEDRYAGPHIRTIASRQAAFFETTGSTRQVFIHRGAPAALRGLILIHELVHFYTHQGFKGWVAATNAPRIYSEGFTEYLARQVMTTAQRQGRSNYANHLQKVETQVARYVSVDDIASAYFNGQVWRLEARSAVSRQLFESQVGLREGASRSTERSQSRTSVGIVQSVAPGLHYRFLNLGISQSQPKAEHVSVFQNIYSTYIQGNSNVRLRFVGHASAPGGTSRNLQLSRGRSQAFYQMARNAGVPASQLIDANRPPHQGESSATAENANVHGRAFNRRVELFIITP